MDEGASSRICRFMIRCFKVVLNFSQNFLYIPKVISSMSVYMIENVGKVKQSLNFLMLGELLCG